MLRQLPALVLLVLLTILAGAKDLALGYCLCQETFFLGADNCSHQEVCLSDCCDSEDNERCSEAKLSDNCSVALEFDIADYFWPAPQDDLFDSAPTSVAFTSFSGEDFMALQKQSLAQPRHLEPPPHARTLPLFLRNRALLL